MLNSDTRTLLKNLIQWNDFETCVVYLAKIQYKIDFFSMQK
jgi:hypothetical protein